MHIIWRCLVGALGVLLCATIIGLPIGLLLVGYAIHGSWGALFKKGVLIRTQ
jgi:hypothetical protein